MFTRLYTYEILKKSHFIKICFPFLDYQPKQNEIIVCNKLKYIEIYGKVMINWIRNRN
jgi:hypothetical protein